MRCRWRARPTLRPADAGGRARAGPSEVGIVRASAAHVYTECARIWNPIHTDVAVARAAGLPGLILHGTATLALAVSRVVARDLRRATPARVREIAVRFTGMVPMPSTVTVRAGARAARPPRLRCASTSRAAPCSARESYA